MSAVVSHFVISDMLSFSFADEYGGAGGKADRALPRAAVPADVIKFLAALLKYDVDVDLPSGSDEQILRALWNYTRESDVVECEVNGEKKKLKDVINEVGLLILPCGATDVGFCV